MKFLYATTQEQYLAAAYLWNEICSLGDKPHGLACGKPPVWFNSLADNQIQSLNDYPLTDSLSERLQYYTSRPRELIDEIVRTGSDTSRRIIALGPSLLRLAAAITYLWKQESTDVSLIFVETADQIFNHLGKGEVVVLASAQNLTHDVMDICISNAGLCDIGFMTARRLEDVTWHWYKSLLWSKRAERDCIFVDGNSQSLERRWPDRQGNGKEAVTISLLSNVLDKPLLHLSLMGHGSGIDMDLGGKGLLCGRTQRSLEVTAPGSLIPFCATENGWCLRDEGGARQIFEADKICAAFLFANTCLGAALGDSHYNWIFSLGLAVIDGPTCASLASHRVRYIDRGENALVERCLLAGMSAGSITRYLNNSLTQRGELASFILFGRPDFKAVTSGKAIPISYGDFNSEDLVKVERNRLSKYWRSLWYWKSMHAPLCKIAGDETCELLQRVFAVFEQALIGQTHMIQRDARKGLDHTNFEAGPAVTEQAARLSEILNPLISKTLKARGGIFVDRVFINLNRSLQSDSQEDRCGCGKPLRLWKLHSLLSSEIERWCLECASCGIILDSSDRDSDLYYDGAIDLRRGETVVASWNWSTKELPLGTPSIHTALLNKLCDTSLITITPGDTEINADGSFRFNQTISVSDNAVPEAYWFWAIVLVDLELTIAMQRLRILK
jgi:hypothetical protein